MEFDADRFVNDIRKLMLHLIRNEKSSSMEDLSDLYTYVGFLEHLTGSEIDVNRLFLNNKKLDEWLAKYYYADANRNINFVNTNFSDLLTLAKSFSPLIDPETPIHVSNGKYSILDRSKCFNEKEYKEILYSFFALYGDNIFKIVKKMFDEKRIVLFGTINKDSDAYTVFSDYTKGAYINCKLGFDADGLSIMAHELGHVIHFYTSGINNSDKKAYTSILGEAISCSFEIAFMDYLMKNHIESDSALLLLNNKLSSDANSYRKYIGVSPDEELVLNIDGEITASPNHPRLIGKPMMADLKYTLGYNIALNMLLTCGDNKKEYVSRLRDFMYLMSKQGLKENIETLGLNYDDFLSCGTIGPYVKEKNQALIRKVSK